MRMSRSVGVWVVAGCVASASGWAETTPDRTARTRELRGRIVELERRLADASADAPERPIRPADIRLVIARRHLQAARQLLQANNERAARSLAGQAERLLDTAATEQAR